MCDIGRFDYHFVEGDDRLQRPLVRNSAGELATATWHDLLVQLRSTLGSTSAGLRGRLRFLASAHASLEELALLVRLARGLHGEGAEAQIALGWRVSQKVQPSGTRFVVPALDAPNVEGARDLGLRVAAAEDGAADLSALRAAIDAGEAQSVYVLDPGPAGSLGDVGWLVDARRDGRVKVLIVQGIVLTDLARAADFVLPGASYLEKDACFTSDRHIVQATSRVVAPPGDAMEDWQILVNMAVTLAVPLTCTSVAQIRAEIAAALPGRAGYAGLAQIGFARPTARRSALDASNPSERRKWETMFKDLPPVKFADGSDPTSKEG
jgi:predicted molibdopterin-dependent oxidoreductase YjgC